MQINSLQSAGAVHSATRPANSRSAASATETASIPPTSDQLDFSAEAQQLLSGQSLSAIGSTSSAANEIRTERVAAIRQAIADGTYESPEKLSIALDRMLDSFA